MTGVALSPVVLCAQFYTLRLAGVSFETTAALLPWMNLPAAYWVVKKFDRDSLPDKKALVATALILLIPLGLEQQAHGDFLAWLERQPKGRLLVEDAGFVAWLMEYTTIVVILRQMPSGNPSLLNGAQSVSNQRRTAILTRYPKGRWRGHEASEQHGYCVTWRALSFARPPRLL